MGEESDEGDEDIGTTASSVHNSDEGAKENNHVILRIMRIQKIILSPLIGRWKRYTIH